MSASRRCPAAVRFLRSRTHTVLIAIFALRALSVARLRQFRTHFGFAPSRGRDNPPQGTVGGVVGGVIGNEVGKRRD